MIKVIIPQIILSKVTDNIIEDTVYKLFNTKKYTIEQENRKKWRYIKIINTDTNEIHFVCYSNPDNDSRNSHLMQFISPAYVEFFNNENNNKKFDIYLIDPNKNDKTDYIKFFYRCFLTLWFNVIQLNNLWIWKIMPFNDYNDLKYARDSNREKNSWNNSTFFTDDDEYISFYWKVFWANAMETFLLILTLNKIAEKEIIYYSVKDNGSKKLSDEQINIIKKLWINIWETIDEITNKDININVDEKSLRNTPKFHYNLLKKFWEKKCYLCGCWLEHLIIWSHIERVTDIQNSTIYNLEEKKSRIVDWDNWLWLCEDHDKMFEYWLIYFNWKFMKINDTVDVISKQFIKNITFDVRKIYYENEMQDENICYDNSGNKVFQIKTSDFTDKMEKYLSLHKKRVTWSNNL